MRKGHKAAIKQVIKEKNYRVDIFDKNNITKDKLFKFKEIHKIDAGRQTRTDKSWECMLEWIEKGKAVLVMLWLEEIKDYAAAALIMMYKNAAYYASYATIDSKILNGHHGYIIQWEAIKYLKSAGIEFYEAGANVYSSLLTSGIYSLIEYEKNIKGDFLLWSFLHLNLKLIYGKNKKLENKCQ